MSTPTAGKDGYVEFAGSQIFLIDTWNLTNTTDTTDVTGYGDYDKEFLATLRSHSGDCSGTLDKSDAQQAALLAQFESGGVLAEVACKFYTAASSYWSFNAIPNSANIGSTVGDKVTISFGLQISGAVTGVTA